MISFRIASVLAGADRRSIGRADEVARLVREQPKLFGELIACLWHDSYVVRMRAADAVEKIAVEKPNLLQRYKSRLLGLLAETEQIELRWHLAQTIPRLKLTPRERQRTAACLRRYLGDNSSIVRAWTLDALAQLSTHDESLRAETKALLEQALRSGTAAMKARARHLLKQFKN